MKSLFRKISCAVLCAALGSSLILGASACDNGPSGAGEEIYVVSITQTEDGYVVLYSDGTSQTFDRGAQQGEGAVASALRSCVSVYCEFIAPADDGEDAGKDGLQNSWKGGSGVIYDVTEDSVYIVTNYHVIYNFNADEQANGGAKTARAVHCYLYGSEGTPSVTGYDDDGYAVYAYGDSAVECRYIGGSRDHDLAVLRADREDVLAVNANACAVTLADGCSVGQQVYAIGNAGGDGISVTAGIISVDSEYVNIDVDSDGKKEEHRLMRFDAAIYHGNSGGGLFDGLGRLVGINNSGYGSYENICYSIPLAVVTGTADNIIWRYLEGDGSDLGAYAAQLNLEVRGKNARYELVDGCGRIREDVVVWLAREGGVAHRAGLEKGDVLTAFIIDGERRELGRAFDIDDIRLTLRPGDEIAFCYVREGAEAVSERVTITADIFMKID